MTGTLLLNRTLREGPKMVWQKVEAGAYFHHDIKLKIKMEVDLERHYGVKNYVPSCGNDFREVV